MLPSWLDFEGYGPRLLSGAELTIELALLAMIIALLLGLLTASAKLSSVAPLRWLATLYTTLIRGVPDLVLMMLLFYGGQVLLNDFTNVLANITNGSINIYINFNAFLAGVVTIGFIVGAYMGESFRGAFQAVDKGQLEAALAFGMSPFKAFMRIRFPLMMRHALPAISNNWMVLLKMTALVSLIGLSDMVFVGNEATRATHHPFYFFIPVALGYLIIAIISELGFSWARKRFNAGVLEERD
ncbi:Histidine transport system permease protein HisQ [Halomonadaceae bacterium LMG 33818]|uniref:ABC transporter permease n=1 Tax=Cernens ardua TaxID=3402176 RepID=UPI003EDC099C